jgi:ATP-binding cassette, subfamily B (MDR/TAP), member 1
VQKALDRVSQNRTTIVIAHRLSTIRKADKIVVLREGKKMEEGTHDSLLLVPDGLYAGLVNAQQLEAESEPATASGAEIAELEVLEREYTLQPETENVQGLLDQSHRGFFQAVGRLLYEQNRYWPFWVIIVAAAMGIGCKWSLVSARAKRKIHANSHAQPHLHSRAGSLPN